MSLESKKVRIIYIPDVDQNQNQTHGSISKPEKKTTTEEIESSVRSFLTKQLKDNSSSINDNLKKQEQLFSDLSQQLNSLKQDVTKLSSSVSQLQNQTPPSPSTLKEDNNVSQASVLPVPEVSSLGLVQKETIHVLPNGQKVKIKYFDKKHNRSSTERIIIAKGAKETQNVVSSHKSLLVAAIIVFSILIAVSATLGVLCYFFKSQSYIKFLNWGFIGSIFLIVLTIIIFLIISLKPPKKHS